MLIFGFHYCIAQTDSLLQTTMEDIEIKSTRIASAPLEQPYSVILINSEQLQTIRRQLSLKEYLDQAPGVFVLNSNNFAQDLRISIRGFGARAAFGIRGIKIIVDGIPETTPDGQGQIDNLQPGIIRKIEVLKGPSSALYGNAAGGVIQLFTNSKIEQPYLQTAITLGSYGLQQYQLNSGFSNRKSRFLVQAAHHQIQGYREQSKMIGSNVNARFFHDFSKKTKLNFQLNYTDSPEAEDPGSLDSLAAQEDRRQARPRNVLFKTGESVQQLKAGTRLLHQISERSAIEAYGFYSYRDFEGRIPVTTGGWIDLNRHYGGQGAHYKWKNVLKNGSNTLQIGYEWAFQQDHRRRFLNEEGVKGALSLDQFERFSNLGGYLINHLKTGRLVLTAGLRFDVHLLQNLDRKLDDGDQSDARTLQAFSPSVGVNYAILKHLNGYLNYRTGFETPTLSELSANPGGAAGFNTALQPQLANNYELGFKGIINNKFDFDLTGFFVNTKADLVPFELDSLPGRTFYRNAGSTHRIGMEVWGRYFVNARFNIRGSYMFSHFTYHSYQLGEEDFTNNFLPGLPANKATLQLTYVSKKGLNLLWEHQYLTSFFANDANSSSEPSNYLSNFSGGYQIQLKRAVLTPFFGLRNLFNANYSDNVRINAFGGRYYEPAPGTNVYGGVRFRLVLGKMTST